MKTVQKHYKLIESVVLKLTKSLNKFELRYNDVFLIENGFDKASIFKYPSWIKGKRRSKDGSELKRRKNRGPKETG